MSEFLPMAGGFVLGMVGFTAVSATKTGDHPTLGGRCIILKKKDRTDSETTPCTHIHHWFICLVFLFIITIVLLLVDKHGVRFRRSTALQVIVAVLFSGVAHGILFYDDWHSFHGTVHL